MPKPLSPAQARIAFQLGANNALNCRHPGTVSASGSVDVANLKMILIFAPKPLYGCGTLFMYIENAEQMWTANFQSGQFCHRINC